MVAVIIAVLVVIGILLDIAGMPIGGLTGFDVKPTLRIAASTSQLGG